MSATVIKRDGSSQKFDSTKIEKAVLKALVASGESKNSSEDASRIAQLVTESLTLPAAIESIQDTVELQLMKNNFFETAKKYILYRNKRAELRSKTSGEDSEFKKLVEETAKYFEGDPLRQLVYTRTYSRWIPEKGRRETWIETVDRYISFMVESIGDRFDTQLLGVLRESILRQEVMPSMRLLQFAGPPARRCHLCVYNCSYTAPRSLRDLAEIMYLSMSGCGVGWSVESKYVNQLPLIAPQAKPPIDNQSDAAIINRCVVDDSKEGWCDAFYYGLTKWYAGEDVEFDFSLLRPAGARLKTMGGQSSGPAPLIDLLKFTRQIILAHQGERLSTLNLYDIICKIGQIVVSGGVRRSAMISLSDLSDTGIRDAKTGEFWNRHPQRSLANNSAVYTHKPSMIEFLDEWISLAKSGTGERGIFNRGGLVRVMPNRRIRLIGDSVSDIGTNPCGEILLQPYQLCNLSEVICRADDTEKSLLRKIEVASILGTYQSSLTDFKYVSEKWIENQKSERLLGVSLSGQWDCAAARDPEVLKKLRDRAIQVNQKYSEILGINASSSVTAIKPSGTVSQLVNCSSGLHARFAPYYIRRVRISARDPLFLMMKDQGISYHPEVGQSEPNVTTYVLEFPVESPQGAICAKSLTALEQLEHWKKIKLSYTEHNPSCTIYIKDGEWLEVAQWLWSNWDYITGISFLPYSEHIYQLAPYEEITPDKYRELKDKLPVFDFSKITYYEKSDVTDVKKELACVGGVCERD